MHEDDEDVAPFEDRVAIYQAWIDSGTAWRLEGSVGREAFRLIDEGYCVLGPERVTDYWGNVVPAHTDIEDGYPGSLSYRAERHPELVP